ncbi:flagellar hook-basal body complex protein FliE [Carnobacteriaceae bacterium 52-44]|jgi:flagellar hook-basal body complex protein FliE
MNINNLKLLESLYPTTSTQTSNNVNELSTRSLQKDNSESFSNILNNSLNNLEEKQLASDYAIQGLITGEADDLHNVMIQTTEAQLALELAVQLRNRSLEAMNEIKNMQF